MGQFFDVTQTPATMAIRTLMDYGALARQQAVTKELNDSSQLTQMKTAALGQEMAAQQQAMQRQMEFRQGMGQILEQQKATTPTGQPAEATDQPPNTTTQMAQQLQKWQQQRQQWSQIETLGLSKGLSGAEMADLRTRGTELDTRIQRGQEDLVKYQQKRGEFAANILRGADSPQSLEAGLAHIDDMFPGEGRAIKAKLIPDPLTGAIDPTTPANKAQLDPYINSYVNIGADLKGAQIKNLADYRAQRLEQIAAAQAEREKVDNATIAARQAGSDARDAKSELEKEKLKAQIDALTAAPQKTAQAAATKAGGPATTTQKAGIQSLIAADPDLKDLDPKVVPGFVTDVANQANALYAAALNKDNAKGYSYQDAVNDAFTSVKPALKQVSAGGLSGLIGGKQTTYDRSVLQKRIAEQAKSDVEASQAQAKGASAQFGNPTDVQAAVRAGTISRADGVRILKDQFGYGE